MKAIRCVPVLIDVEKQTAFAKTDSLRPDTLQQSANQVG